MQELAAMLRNGLDQKGATVNAPSNSDQSSHSSPQLDLSAPSSVDPGDQDIDTAATSAYDEFASGRGDFCYEPASAESDLRIAVGDAVDNDDRPIGPHNPSSMPRGEDDAALLARSPEFHGRPGSGKYR